MSAAIEEPQAAQNLAGETKEQEDCGVRGQQDLFEFLDKSQMECLNEADDHPLIHCLQSGGGFLESDSDEELIVSLTFNQSVKVHSIKIGAPKDSGPKTLRIFQNLPPTLDFDKAANMAATHRKV